MNSGSKHRRPRHWWGFGQWRGGCRSIGDIDDYRGSPPYHAGTTVAKWWHTSPFVVREIPPWPKSDRVDTRHSDHNCDKWPWRQPEGGKVQSRRSTTHPSYHHTRSIVLCCHRTGSWSVRWCRNRSRGTYIEIGGNDLNRIVCNGRSVNGIGGPYISPRGGGGRHRVDGRRPRDLYCGVVVCVNLEPLISSYDI